jgi:hypothetical protein
VIQLELGYENLKKNAPQQTAHLFVLLLRSCMPEYGLLGLQQVGEVRDQSLKPAEEHLRTRSTVQAIHGLLLLWTRRVALKTFVVVASLLTIGQSQQTGGGSGGSRSPDGEEPSF